MKKADNGNVRNSNIDSFQLKKTTRPVPSIRTIIVPGSYIYI